MPSRIPAQELDRAFAEIICLEGYLPPRAARYLEKDVIGYLSPDAIHSYSLEVLRTYAYVLGKRGKIPEDVAEEIVKNVRRENVPFLDSRDWEDRIHHDVRAMVRNAQEKLSDRAKSFVYPGLTSYDVLCTAYSLALKDFAFELMIPKSLSLLERLSERADKHKETLMMGRTHKQHATVTTAGHWFCEVMDGILRPLQSYSFAARKLRGKLSGFVGNNAARALLFGSDSIDDIDNDFFDIVDILSDIIPSQVVHQHCYTDYFSQLTTMCGGVAKFAGDVRNYQQTEVGEMMEQAVSDQVGSSTGAHKKNPIICEQISGGMWRQMRALLISCYEDIVTDFQRDLRDSSNKRFYVYDMGNIGYGMVRKALGITREMTIRSDRMAENIGITKGLVCAEPLQNFMQRWIGMTGRDFVDTHEYVGNLCNKALEENLDFREVMLSDSLVLECLKSAKPEEKDMITDPVKYIGTSIEDTERYLDYVSSTASRLIKQRERHLEAAEKRL